jgi:glyoxylase-like metal-dependent hydrolase (beta-lactamase superfamily II)
MTLDGTNTWILAEPGSGAAVIVDPGPDDDRHVAAITGHLTERGLAAALIIQTHGHADHSGATATLHRATAAPVRAWRTGAATDLVDGEVIEVGGLTVRVIATPGHSSDSVTLALPADAALLTEGTTSPPSSACATPLRRRESSSPGTARSWSHPRRRSRSTSNIAWPGSIRCALH